MITRGWESIANDMIPKEKTNGIAAAWRQNALPQVAVAKKIERYNILKWDILCSKRMFQQKYNQIQPASKSCQFLKVSLDTYVV